MAKFSDWFGFFQLPSYLQKQIPFLKKPKKPVPKKPQKPKKPAKPKKPIRKKGAKPGLSLSIQVGTPARGASKDAAQNTFKLLSAKQKEVKEIKKYLEELGQITGQDLQTPLNLQFGVGAYPAIILGSIFDDLGNWIKKSGRILKKDTAIIIDQKNTENQTARDIKALFASPEQFVNWIREAYDLSVGKYFKTVWPVTARYYDRDIKEKTSSGGTGVKYDPTLSSANTKQFSRNTESIRAANARIARFLVQGAIQGLGIVPRKGKTAAGGTTKFFVQYVLSTATIEQLIENSVVQRDRRPVGTTYSSAFMMLEFGTGIRATPVRPYVSATETPWKVPPPTNKTVKDVLGVPYRPGMWMPETYMIELFRQLNEGIESTEGRERSNLNLLTGLFYNKYVKKGFPGVHAFFKPDYRKFILSPNYLRALAQFHKQLQKAIQRDIDRLASSFKLRRKHRIKFVVTVTRVGEELGVRVDINRILIS